MPSAAVDTPEAFRDTFLVSRETVEKLATYEALLKRWQKTINLVAPSTLDNVWHRHFADSAQLATLAPTAKDWLDIGSGAGFPGLVLAILHGDSCRHVLVESDSRKAAFLREVARATGTTVDILCTRIENPETRDKVGAVDCVTARALAPLPRLAALVMPYLDGPGSSGLFLKGKEVAAEISEASTAWDFDYDLRPSMSSADGCVLLLRALKPKTKE